MASRKRKPEELYVSPEESRIDDNSSRRPNMIEFAKQLIPGKGGRFIEWPCPMEFNEFCYYILGYKMWSIQRECANLMVNELNFAWATGQKLGKTDALSCCLIHHIYIRDESRGIFIAPTQRQVADVVWKKVQQLWRRSGICYDCRKAGVRIAPCMHSSVLPGECFETAMSGITTPWGNDLFGFSATDPDKAQGFSSPHLRWAIDEGSGISRPMWEAVMGNRMGGAPLTACLNPVCTSGPAYDAFHKQKDEWCLRQTSSEESPNFTGEAERDFGGPILGLAEPVFVRWAERTYGRDSVWFITRVLAQFATSFELQIFPWHITQAAVDRWTASQGSTGHLQIGYDPAGIKLTGDKNALAAVRGSRCLGMRSEKGLLLLGGHVGYVSLFIDEYRQGTEMVVLVVDAAGAEGAKALTALQAYEEQQPDRWLRVIPVYSGAFPPEHTQEREHYHSIRDVLFAHCSEWLANDGAIPFDEALTEQMALPSWSVDEKGQRRAPVKDDMRKAMSGRRSPDELDALCLATYHGHELAGVLEPDDDSELAPPMSAERYARQAQSELTTYLRNLKRQGGRQ